jgi:hypothetical protein
MPLVQVLNVFSIDRLFFQVYRGDQYKNHTSAPRIKKNINNVDWSIFLTSCIFEVQIEHKVRLKKQLNAKKEW